MEAIRRLYNWIHGIIYGERERETKRAQGISCISVGKVIWQTLEGCVQSLRSTMASSKLRNNMYVLIE